MHSSIQRSPIEQLLRRCTFKLWVNDGSTFAGTGFLVLPNQLLTCRHVLQDPLGNWHTAFTIEGVKGNFAIHKNNRWEAGGLDLVLIDLGKAVSEYCLNLAYHRPKRGDSLWAYTINTNYPDGAFINTQLVETAHYHGMEVFRMEKDIVTVGSSGTPIWNLSQHCLLGMAYWEKGKDALVIPTAYIQQYYSQLFEANQLHHQKTGYWKKALEDSKAFLQKAMAKMQQDHSGEGDNVGRDKIEKQVRAETYVENQTIIQQRQRKIPHLLTEAPFQIPLFLGREKELSEIHQQLFSENPLLLLVNGQGGVGKTSLAAKYFSNYQKEYQHIAWVLKEQSIADALLKLAPELEVAFDETMNRETQLRLLLKHLLLLPTPSLLIIDNANDLEDLDDYFWLLSQLRNFHVLLTTRINEYELATTYYIGGLPKNDALKLFKKYYPQLKSKEIPLFQKIRVAVGENTLVIELLAKNLAQINSRFKTRYSLENLLSDIQQKGLLQLTQTQNISTPYQSKKARMRKEKPEDVIAAMYEISDLSEIERRLLAVFAVLPAKGIDFEDLELLLGGEEEERESLRQLKEMMEDNESLVLELLEKEGISKEALEIILQQNTALDELDLHLEALTQKGWLEYNEEEEAFKCSPVIQEIVRQKNTKLLSDVQKVIDTLINKLASEGQHLTGSDYQKAKQYVSYAEAITMALNQPNNDIAILCERIGTYYTITGNLDRALKFFEQRSKLGEELYQAYPQNVSFKNGLAISYEKLGSTHSSLGNLDRALKFFEQYNHLTEELYQAYPQNVSFKNGLAISYSKLGETHSSLGNLDRALKFFEDETKLGEELYQAYPQNVSFKNGLAISYIKLGSIYEKRGDEKEATAWYQKSEQLYLELVGKFPQYVEFQRNLKLLQNRLG